MGSKGITYPAPQKLLPWRYVVMVCWRHWGSSSEAILCKDFISSVKSQIVTESKTLLFHYVPNRWSMCDGLDRVPFLAFYIKKPGGVRRDQLAQRWGTLHQEGVGLSLCDGEMNMCGIQMIHMGFLGVPLPTCDHKWTWWTTPAYEGHAD